MIQRILREGIRRIKATTERTGLYFPRKYILNKYLNSKKYLLTQDSVQSSHVFSKPKLNRLQKSVNLLTNGSVKPTGIPQDRIVYATPSITEQIPTINKIKDAVLLGKVVPFGFTSNMNLLIDTIDYNTRDGRVEKTFMKGTTYDDILSLYFEGYRKRKLKKGIDLDMACILSSRWTHYGHWMLEHALKLPLLEKYELATNEKPKLILERNAPQWKMDFLELAGYDMDRIYLWSGEVTRVNNLVLPTYPQPNYEGYLWIKNKVLGDDIEKLSDYRKIYVSRKNCSYRVIKNENELIPILLDYGFTIVVPEEFSVKEQAQIFSNAKIIIGPHGSGLANILYSDNASVIEIFGHHVPLAFYRLAIVMGHTYIPMYCKPVQDAKKIVSDKEIYVDPIEFSKVVGRVLSSYTKNN